MRRNLLTLIGIAALISGASVWALGKKAADPSKPEEISSSSSSTSSEDTVWVVRSDGGKSCSAQAPQSLEGGAEELKKNSIRVLNSTKGSDGLLHMQVCGASTGSLNAYQIPKASLGQALALGFREAPPTLRKRPAKK